MAELKIPKDFKISARAPKRGELQWLYQWLKENGYDKKVKNVLEFGCGVTTWTIDSAVNPERYVAVEQFRPCIEMVQGFVPKVEVVETDWYDIPDVSYDLVFVDGSCGCPEDLKEGRAKIRRYEATRYAERFTHGESIIILHDWHHHKPYRRARKYLEESEYELLGHKRGKYGIGVYRNGAK